MTTLLTAEPRFIRVVSKGGPGSGHFGHEGRPGEVGGSGPGEGVGDGKIPITGKPIQRTVYHGTSYEFEEFDISMAGKHRGTEGTLLTFTDDIKDAREYATSYEAEGKSPRVITAKVDLENPLVVSTSEDPTTYYDDHAKELIGDFDDGGHDGIIVRGIRDGKISHLFAIEDESKVSILSSTSIQKYYAVVKAALGPTESPAPRDENQIHHVMRNVFRRQGQSVIRRLRSEGAKVVAKHPLPDIAKWDKEILSLTEPARFVAFKKGGDQALTMMRKPMPRIGKESNYNVDVKAAKRPRIDLPEWIEAPEVIEALRREGFRFAHEVDQTTADALRETLMEGVENGETISELEMRVRVLSDEWAVGNRAEMIARTEASRAFNSGHAEAWRQTGVVSKKMWWAAGDACPFCRDMHGTTVGLDDDWYDKGDEAEVEFEDKPLAMSLDYGDTGNPPLHPNCRCVLVPILEGETEGIGEEWKGVKTKYIRKVDDEYCVFSHQTGRNFGCYPTRAEAEARLRQIGRFSKNVKGGEGSGHFGHEGRPGEVGGSGPGGGEERIIEETPTKDQLDRASKVFTTIQDTSTVVGRKADSQMRGGVLNENTGNFKEFTSATKQSNLNSLVRELDNLKQQDPEGFELARQWDLADRFGKKTYGEIPDVVTVWRGHSEEESLGKTVNVSHKREVADKFGESGIVTEFAIKKSDIIFALSNSVFDEGELIVRGKSLSQVGRTVSDSASRRIEFREWASSAKVGMEIKTQDGRVGTLQNTGVGNTLIVKFPDFTDYSFSFSEMKR